MIIKSTNGNLQINLFSWHFLDSTNYDYTFVYTLTLVKMIFHCKNTAHQIDQFWCRIEVDQDLIKSDIFKNSKYFGRHSNNHDKFVNVLKSKYQIFDSGISMTHT